MVRPTGIEPITSWSVAKRSIQLSYERIYKNGGSEWNRTTDTGIFSPLLYRLSYRANKKMAVSTGIEPAIFCVTGRRGNHCTTRPFLVAGEGFEPTTFGLWAQRATGLLYPAIKQKNIGGGKGIRTPAPLTRPPGFQDRSLQPDLGIPP